MALGLQPRNNIQLLFSVLWCKITVIAFPLRDVEPYLDPGFQGQGDFGWFGQVTYFSTKFKDKYRDVTSCPFKGRTRGRVEHESMANDTKSQNQDKYFSILRILYNYIFRWDSKLHPVRTACTSELSSIF